MAPALTVPPELVRPDPLHREAADHHADATHGRDRDLDLPLARRTVKTETEVTSAGAMMSTRAPGTNPPVMGPDMTTDKTEALPADPTSLITTMTGKKHMVMAYGIRMITTNAKISANALVTDLRIAIHGSRNVMMSRTQMRIQQTAMDVVLPLVR